MPDPAPLTLILTRRAADRLRAGHLWVYRSDLQPNSPGADPDTGSSLPPGAWVRLQDANGRPLGTGLYSSRSQIAARLLSTDPDFSSGALPQLIRDRVHAALALRRREAPLDTHSTAQRLLFSEADALPGIVADRYGSLIVVQLLTQGMAQPAVRQALVEALAEALPGQPLTVWERPDPRIRELEDLGPISADPLFTSPDAGPHQQSTFLINGLRFGYDIGAGQKTGAFLDQRLNYLAAAEAIRASARTGRALDICTYQGGFALHLARVCQHVTGVDQSRAALETAERNLDLNRSSGQITTAVDWLEADAFELLRALDDATGKSNGSLSLPHGLTGRFDAIVLDPPAFAKTRRAVEGALRGYKELNLRAMRLLEPGGTLVTNSCSHHVSAADFLEAVRSAAVDAGRRVQLLELRRAAPDHPEILTLPETAYLKCAICRIL